MDKSNQHEGPAMPSFFPPFFLLLLYCLALEPRSYQSEHVVSDPPLHRDRFTVLQLDPRSPTFAGHVLEPFAKLFVQLGYCFLLAFLRCRLFSLLLWCVCRRGAGRIGSVVDAFADVE